MVWVANKTHIRNKRWYINTHTNIGNDARSIKNAPSVPVQTLPETRLSCVGAPQPSRRLWEIMPSWRVARRASASCAWSYGIRIQTTQCDLSCDAPSRASCWQPCRMNVIQTTVWSMSSFLNMLTTCAPMCWRAIHKKPHRQATVPLL